MKTNSTIRQTMTAMVTLLLLIPPRITAQEQATTFQQEKKPDSAAWYLQKGNQFRQQQKFTEALAAYETACRFEPGNDEAILGQMKVNFSTGKLDEGFRVMEDWVNLEPENPVAWHTLSMYKAVAGKNEEALKANDRLMELCPDSASYWNERIGLLFASERFDDALKAADKAVAISPKSPQSWYYKAYCLAKVKQFDQAVDAANKAISLDPGAAEGYYTRACIYAQKGEKRNALADLARVIGTDPSFRKRAQADTDFRGLYNDQDFKQLTGEVNEAASADSVCSIPGKNYLRKDYVARVSGSWKVVRAYVHGENLLGERLFLFIFKPDGTIGIKEKATGFDVKGTWKIGETTNTIAWTMPDENNSLNGKFDFLGSDLVISGPGFIGKYEHVCLRMMQEK